MLGNEMGKQQDLVHTPNPVIPLAPISANERIAFLDILRGIALWGVLASNMIGVSSPDIHFAPSLIWTDSVSRIVAFLLDVLVSEKFITIFAVLFGIGFAIQMERAASRGLVSLAGYRRRLLVLLLFGLINGLFIWAGDILVTYAVFGLLLLLFRNSSQKTILWWAVGLQGLLFLMSFFVRHIGRSPSEQIVELQQTINLYGHGTWQAIQQARFKDFMERHVGSLPILLLFVFPRFLFGLWFWRSGFLKNLRTRKPFLRQMCFWGITIGIAGETATSVYTMGDMGTLRVLCIPLLSAGYVSGIALLMLSGKLPRLYNSFAAVGRTSLSNYLFQTVLCTTLFYSYGFGLFGSLSPLSGLGFTTLIFAVEIYVSVWWMKKFQFGPMEWIWRSVTYRRWQTMTRLQAGE
jgi:uncharacterized protein